MMKFCYHNLPHQRFGKQSQMYDAVKFWKQTMATKNLACLDFVSQILAINQSGTKFSCRNTIYSYLIKFLLLRIHILELFIP
jgi:hypothetical protein